MSGILNKKHQLIDLVVTEEGRRQLSFGKFRPTFASFTDKESYYDEKETSALPSKDRIYFQTPAALSTDNIIYETDERGRLFFSSPDSGFSIRGEELFSTASIDQLTSTSIKNILQTGSLFSSTVELFKNKTLDAFSRNKLIQSSYGFDADVSDFKTDVDNHTFVLSNSVPFEDGPLNHCLNINNAETFMFDSKLAHHKNFMYLPPKNANGTDYGSYEDFRSTTKEEIEDIYNYLRLNNKMPDSPFVPSENETVYDFVNDYKVLNRAPGLLPGDVSITKEYVQIHFTDTSLENNVITQIFEESTTDGKIKKLDIIDAGQFEDSNDQLRPHKHVFYLGKIIFDDLGIPSFINMFTVVWD